MRRKIFPKIHDLLKLVGRIDASDVHYCPERLSDALEADEFVKIQNHDLYPSLRHHCYLAGWRHGCPSAYPIGREELFLSFSDWQASTISRKLRTSGFRSWRTFRIWKNSKDTHEKGQEPYDQEIIRELVAGKEEDKIFISRMDSLIERAEDMRYCPFASLLTHSELTERWYRFLIKNCEYFEAPDQFEDRRDARRYIYRFVIGRQRKPIYFIRMKVLPNEKLSRLADTQVIYQIREVLKALQNQIPRSEPLYYLSDELILVACPPAGDKIKDEEFLEELTKELQKVYTFTTSYYVELTFLRTTFLRKEFLYNFDRLFGEYVHRIYPPLPEILRCPPDSDNDSFLAKICELCQLAPAQETFKKFREGDVEIREFLCDSCYALREAQLDENGNPKGKIGKDFAAWDEDPRSHACFIKINLDLTKLNTCLSTSLLSEFQPKLRLVREQDIGFSIIGEFLQDYQKFLKELWNELCEMPQYVSPYHVWILENCFCLRMEHSSQVEQIIDHYYELYSRYFPRWRESTAPINFSISFSTMKHPFFEHWRFLNDPKHDSISIQYVRNCRLDISFDKYEILKQISTNSQTSRFLHKLAVIEETTTNDLLVRCAIIENRRELGDLFSYFSQNRISAQEILNFYKIFRREV